MNIWDFLKLERNITGVTPETVFYVHGFPIANSTMMIVLILFIIIILGIWCKKSIKEIPGVFQSIIEMIYEAIHGHINKITGSDHHTNRVFPIIGAVFVYIGISNYIGILIPGLTNITFNGVALFRTPTTDFNTTLGLAAGSILLIQLVSIKDWGILGHLGKYFPVKEFIHQVRTAGFMGILIGFVYMFLGVLDIIGEIAKIISISLRLFGNMYAGEVLLTIFLGLFAYMLPGVIIAIGLLSGIVQTIVFGSLITIFYMLAAKPVEVELKTQPTSG